MTTTTLSTSTISRSLLRRAGASAFFTLALVITLGGASGCGMDGPEEETDDVGQVEPDQSQALARGGGSRGLSYSCTNGTCTCDKSIENDCANMSGVCTDATVDALINCINGWLTTHCTCTQGFVAPPPKPYRAPTSGVVNVSAAR